MSTGKLITLIITGTGVIVGAVIGIITLGYNYGVNSQQSYVKTLVHDIDLARVEIKELEKENEILKSFTANAVGYISDEVNEGQHKEGNDKDIRAKFLVSINSTTEINGDGLSLSLLETYSKAGAEKGSYTAGDLSVYEPGLKPEKFIAVTIGDVFQYGDYEIFILDITYSSMVVSIKKRLQ
ncbi:TPA: hypothetical protein PC537_000980 [Morganella morganii]|nr:hypothetical protein [Morganella morganii]